MLVRFLKTGSWGTWLDQCNSGKLKIPLQICTDLHAAAHLLHRERQHIYFLAMSGALPVMITSSSRSIFRFSLSPMPECCISHSWLLRQYLCNWNQLRQLTQQSSYDRAYPRLQRSLFLLAFPNVHSLLPHCALDILLQIVFSIYALGTSTFPTF